MSRRVRWTTRAATQLEAAALYLEESRPDTGLRFVESLESILLLASERPAMFPRVPQVQDGEVRRALLRRYGYWIIYEIRRDDILVLSVWHGTRRPEGWRDS